MKARISCFTIVEKFLMSQWWQCRLLRQFSPGRQYRVYCLLQYNLIPRARLSLKVLAELPIIVVLMYQLYKPSVHTEVSEFIPLIMNTIVLHPTQQQRYPVRDPPVSAA